MAKQVIGIYPDLNADNGPRFAEDVKETLRYKKLLDEGYEVVGTITKDTTEEEKREIANRIADKVRSKFPPEEDPFWDALIDYLWDNWISSRTKVHAAITGDEDLVNAFEAALQEHLDNGGDEEEFCAQYYDDFMNGVI